MTTAADIIAEGKAAAARLAEAPPYEAIWLAVLAKASLADRNIPDTEANQLIYEGFAADAATQSAKGVTPAYTEDV